VQLHAGSGSGRIAAHAWADVPVVLIDVLDDATLLAAGQLVWEGKGGGVFTASSSGLQYALTAYWRQRGWIAQQTGLPDAESAPVIAAVSGSCSPVTASQIEWAARNGFATERLDLWKILRAETAQAEIERVVELACDSIRQGISPIVYSAKGPDDPAVLGFATLARDAGHTRASATQEVGAALAEIMKRLLDRTSLGRVVVAGGDSSGEVASMLGISALAVKAAMAPGAPLCRAYSHLPHRDGLEIVLKGGQIGDDSFFGKALTGQSFDG